ncbi:hypothetical protein [Micromonospora musae]|uniref:hypothetical protein n=1 Tax=Micromonospora musae TaxID=1894970 RepID=UPI0033DA21E7
MAHRRHGHVDGQQFDHQVDAKRFAALVDANGNHRPTSEQLVEHGFPELLPPAWPSRRRSPANRC